MSFLNSSTAQVFPGQSVINLLLEMPTGDTWNDGELWTVYEYLRGSKALCLPDPYRVVLFQSSA